MFTAATTQASALAYALARFYRARGATTVIGGPHAKGFPEDSVRFFDIVVKQSDEALIGDILGGFSTPTIRISVSAWTTRWPVWSVYPRIDEAPF